MKICRKSGWALVLLTLLAVSGRPAGAKDDFEWKTVPSSQCRGLWVVPVTYGGKPGGTLHLVLDTGASQTTIDPDALERVTGRRVRAGRKVRMKNLAAGPLQIHSIKMLTHEFDHIARALGTEADGLLGFPVFEKILLELDYPAGEVRVARGALPPVDGKGVFEDIGSLRPYLPLELGGKTTPILIDSGFSGALTLRRSDSLDWEVTPRPVNASVRFESIRFKDTGRAAGTHPFGPLRLERPIVDLIEEGTRLAGVQIMDGSSWVFDTRNRRIRITPEGSPTVRFEPLVSLGLAFRPVDAGFEVIQVFEDTPAAEADLQPGDVITEIEGVPVYQRGCRTLDEMGGEAALTLTVRRGAKQLTPRVSKVALVP